MDFYLGVINIIFFGFCKSDQTKNICGNDGDLLICCSNYQKENGECVACPYGSFGVNCSKACPSGFFGKFCAKVCNCSENEMCDEVHGCLDNTTEEVSKLQFETEYSTTNIGATRLTDVLTTKQQDTESRAELPALPLFLYFVSAGCASLLCVICVIVINRTFKCTRGKIKQNNPSTPPPTSPPPIPPLESGRQDISLHGVPTVHAEASGSDYADIHECNPTYSSCAEASSIYNVLSFSRSKYRGEIFNNVSGIYSTSKSCSLQKKETMKRENKLDETDDTKLGPTDRVDVTEKGGNGEANISQKQQD